MDYYQKQRWFIHEILFSFVWIGLSLRGYLTRVVDMLHHGGGAKQTQYKYKVEQLWSSQTE